MTQQQYNSTTIREKLINLARISSLCAFFLRITTLVLSLVFFEDEVLDRFCVIGVVVYFMAFIMTKMNKYYEKYYFNFYILHIETCIFVYNFISVYGFGYGFELQLLLLIIFSYFTVIKDRFISYVVCIFEIFFFIYMYFVFDAGYALDDIYVKPICYTINMLVLVYVLYNIQNIFAIGKYLRIITTENQKKYFQSKSSNDRLTEVLNIYSFKELVSVKFLSNDGMPINSVAFITININDFKTINNTKGYNTGDEILKIFAKMLKNNCEADQLISRMGGDKFIIAVFNEDENYVKKLAMSIEDSTKMNQFTKFKTPININIGICFANFPTFEQVNEIIQESLYNMDYCKIVRHFMCFSIHKDDEKRKDIVGIMGGGNYKI